MADFTPTQGRYLAFIHAYSRLHGYAPAEADIVMAMRVAPPSVHNMIKALEKKGFIHREPGTARSIKILVPPDEIPEWESSGSSPPTAASRARRSTRNAQVIRRAPFVPDSEEKVYVLNVALIGRRFGSRKSHKKALPREIEICGDQTLVVLHNAIFDAYDRYDEHLYEFEFGEPGVRNHLVTCGITGDEDGSARTMTLQRLRLKPGQQFGY